MEQPFLQQASVQDTGYWHLFASPKLPTNAAGVDQSQTDQLKAHLHGLLTKAAARCTMHLRAYWDAISSLIIYHKGLMNLYVWFKINKPGSLANQLVTGPRQPTANP
eukprot:1154084-Pelagomonas_calceolata.AAC.3